MWHRFTMTTIGSAVVINCCRLSKHYRGIVKKYFCRWEWTWAQSMPWMLSLPNQIRVRKLLNWYRPFKKNPNLWVQVFSSSSFLKPKCSALVPRVKKMHSGGVLGPPDLVAFITGAGNKTCQWIGMAELAVIKVATKAAWTVWAPQMSPLEPSKPLVQKPWTAMPDAWAHSTQQESQLPATSSHRMTCGTMASEVNRASKSAAPSPCSSPFRPSNLTGLGELTSSKTLTCKWSAKRPGLIGLLVSRN